MATTLSKKFVSTVLIVALLAAAGIGYWLQRIRPYETTDNAYLKAHTTAISAKESGYVKSVRFQDNQHVMPGDLLVEIDDKDFRARVAQAEAQLELERARVKTLETDKLTQAARVLQENANIAASEAELQRAGKDLQRFGSLVKEGAVSVQTRDSAESLHRQARAQLDKYRSARQEADSRLVAVDAQIDEAYARINAAEANLELARIALSNTRVVAPMAGIIGNRSVQVGQLLRPGSVLAFLVPADDLFVEANFKETQIGQMQLGQPVEMQIDAYPERTFSGIVDSFAPASGSEFSLLPPENASGNFTKIVRRVPVKIAFRANEDLGKLRPGLSATISVKVR
jgi:membrane fusion protein (multidrug efflux system)